MMGDFYHVGYGAMYGLGTFLTIVFWGLLIWAIIAFIRGASRHHGRGCCGRGDKHEHHSESEHSHHHHGDKALAIIREAYASGKMTKEEFLEKKKELTQ